MSAAIPTVEDSDVLLTFAEQLAGASGRAILPHFRNVTSVDNKSAHDFDPVTIADKDGEQAIRTLIERHYPDHGIIGEELPPTNPDAPIQWVLDPIDGTRGFISGIPLWGTLIALCVEGTPVLGVIDQPYLSERFIGLDWDGRREATFRHHNTTKPIATSPCAKLEDATIVTTDPALFTDPGERTAYNAVESACKLARYSTDCYGYGLLAAGQIDLVIESGLSDYDYKALLPVIRAAGGTVTDWAGNDNITSGQVVAAATPALHQAALTHLKNAAL